MVTAGDKYIHSQEIRDELKKAHLLRLGERYQEALELLYLLLDKYPGNPVILNNIGNVYLSEGRDYDEAERCFFEAYEKAPEFTIILCTLSRLYAKTGRYEEAAKFARRVITLDPKSPNAWNTLGLYYIYRGKLAIALDYFIASYSCDETYYTGVYNAACALAELRRFDKALRYLEISFAEESSYISALNDDTLATLRELDEFKRIMAEAAERFEK